MAAMASIKVTKSFAYKGATRSWSNRYYFTNDAPSDNTHWTTFSDAVVAAEKLAHFPSVTITGTTGYAAGSELPIFSKSYSQAGTEAGTPNCYMPGDAAGLLKWTTTQRTSKNHPIYLFNYIHGMAGSTAGPNPALNATQVALWVTYGNTWITGISDGTVTHKRAGPNGAVAQGCSMASYATHRDFPR